MDFRDYLNTIEDISNNHEPKVGDIVEIELGDTLLETYIEEVSDDGVIIKVDETALKLMINAKKQLNEMMRMGASSDASTSGSFLQGESLDEGMMKRAMHDDAEEMTLDEFLLKYAESDDDEEYMTEFWNNVNGEDGDEIEVIDADDAVKEAKYRGREVPLGKPMQGDVAKSKVYVRGPKGNVVKVNFGDKNMRIKKSNPKRRKSFRARHRCENPGPRWKARYWSCRSW